MVKRLVFKDLLADTSLLSAGVIGARSSPPEMLKDMEKIGEVFVRRDIPLYSGNAKGADQAFIRGGVRVNIGFCHLMLPWNGYNAADIPLGIERTSLYSKEDEVVAASCHPAWNKLPTSVRSFLIRNAAIARVSDFVVGFVDDSKIGGGGTGHARRCADVLNKSFWNLAYTPDYNEVMSWVNTPMTRQIPLFNAIRNPATDTTELTEVEDESLPF